MKVNNFNHGNFIFGILLCLAFVFSCTPEKRLNRILNRHPELKRDTVYTLHDTVVTKAFSFDTLYNFTHSHDTVVLERRNVQVKIFHNNDTIFVKTNVRPDTIIKTVKIPVRQVVYTIDNKKQWKYFWIGGFVVLLFLAIVVIVLKWINP